MGRESGPQHNEILPDLDNLIFDVRGKVTSPFAQEDRGLGNIVMTRELAYGKKYENDLAANNGDSTIYEDQGTTT